MAVFGLNLGDEDLLLVVVGALYGLQYVQVHLAIVGAGVDEGLDVFREAGAAVAAAGVEELVANAGV